jgi:hypothetical protein
MVASNSSRDMDVCLRNLCLFISACRKRPFDRPASCRKNPIQMPINTIQKTVVPGRYGSIKPPARARARARAHTHTHRLFHEIVPNLGSYIVISIENSVSPFWQTIIHYTAADISIYFAHIGLWVITLQQTCIFYHSVQQYCDKK